jgi:hypothetical protein
MLRDFFASVRFDGMARAGEEVKRPVKFDLEYGSGRVQRTLRDRHPQDAGDARPRRAAQVRNDRLSPVPSTETRFIVLRMPLIANSSRGVSNRKA